MIPDINNNPAVKDFMETGKLPPVNVRLETDNIVSLFTGVVISAVIIILVYRVTQKK